jgi:hypothetical protein
VCDVYACEDGICCGVFGDGDGGVIVGEDGLLVGGEWECVVVGGQGGGEVE